MGIGLQGENCRMEEDARKRYALSRRLYFCNDKITFTFYEECLSGRGNCKCIFIIINVHVRVKCAMKCNWKAYESGRTSHTGSRKDMKEVRRLFSFSWKKTRAQKPFFLPCFFLDISFFVPFGISFFSFFFPVVAFPSFLGFLPKVQYELLLFCSIREFVYVIFGNFLAPSHKHSLLFFLCYSVNAVWWYSDGGTRSESVILEKDQVRRTKQPLPCSRKKPFFANGIASGCEWADRRRKKKGLRR